MTLSFLKILSQVMTQGSVQFKDVFIDLSWDEWKYLNADQKSLYKQVILDTYKHMMTLGQWAFKAKVMSSLKRDSDGWMLMVKEATAAPCSACQPTLDFSPELKEPMHAFRQSSHLNEQPRYNSLRQSHECDDCGIVLSHLSHLVQHKKIHTVETPYRQDGYAKAFRHPFNTYRYIHVFEKLFECNNCGHTSTRASKFMQHQKKHMRAKRHNCDVCDKAFNFYSLLIKHQRIHTGEKPFQCDECGKAFSQKGTMERHKIIHMPGKHFQCSRCEDTFDSRSELTAHRATHRVTHTQSSVYKCEECGKCFRFYSFFSRHQRTHTGEKPFKCDLCEKSYTQEDVLKRHKKTHSGEKAFHCQECGKNFITHYDLIKHVRIHTGEKPYRCDQCDKTFRVSSILNAHKRTHSEATPFVCNCCKKAFKRRSYLLQHEKIHRKSNV
ncbi:zinc finger protein 501-like isoform X1 [Sus scrofa]|nr:zinc finger protein 501-like isoform X1 [Sus scrofa]